MTELQDLIDRADIEALQAEFTDAAMMHDLDRLMALYTEDAVYAIPVADIELSGWEAIRAGTEKMAHDWEFLVQNTHPGSIRVAGDTATGRALVFEVGRQRDGRSILNHGVFHDGYRRTPEGWKFTERVYEVHYFDPTPLAGRRDPATASAGAARFTEPAAEERLERASAALAANNFAVEILDDATAARERIRDLVPEGASVFTGASETLRISGIDADLNTSGRYDAVKSHTLTIDRELERRTLWQLISTPDFIVGSVHAVTETGALVIASASGGQLPGYAGAASHAIWVVGAQKVVPDLDTALRRVENHCLPLENDRAMEAYGQPSALNRMLILNAEPHPGRGTVLLLRDAIGF